MIDQGSADQFLKDQLKPDLLLQAAEEKNFPIMYNLRKVMTTVTSLFPVSLKTT